jgi:hypothetical protein
VDGGLEDVGVRLEHGLDLGRRDVLAAGDDRVRLAPDDAQGAVGPPLPQVARGQHRPRARRHRRTADEDLAVGGEAHLRAEERRPEGGDLRARLGEPVGRRDRHPGGRGAPLQRRRGGRAAEQRPAQGGRLAQPGVEQALQRGRDERDHRRGLLPQQRVDDAIGVEALVHERRRAVDRRAHDDRQPADVRERQRAQPAFARVQAEGHGRPQRAPQPVAVGELDGLGLAARAGGVDDDRRGAEVVTVAQARLGGRGADHSPVDHLDRALGHPCALARAQARVDRDGDGAQAQNRVQGDAERLAGRQGDRDAVAGADPSPREAAGRGVDLAEQLGVGERVDGGAVGVTLRRSRQPGVHEHGRERSGTGRPPTVRLVAQLSGFLR